MHGDSHVEEPCREHCIVQYSEAPWSECLRDFEGDVVVPCGVMSRCKLLSKKPVRQQGASENQAGSRGKRNAIQEYLVKQETSKYEVFFIRGMENVRNWDAHLMKVR